ncbi:hypothetical protein KY285_007727 [Solanum tuberosum]|nr:hypothetical protein KY285_007727 [Solanum tuberosum]
MDVSELSNMLTQEESRLKKQGGHPINLMGQGAGKGFKVNANKFKKKKAPAKVPQDAHKELKEGHYQKDFLKCKDWFEKKGIHYYPNYNPNRNFLFMGNHMKAKIEGIWTYCLILT